MLRAGACDRVYLACGPTDLRKSIDGLAILVSEAFDLNPFSSCLFVFCNRRRDKVKILHWEGAGFWLYYYRLEKGRFRWPMAESDRTVTVSRRQLQWLLDGLGIEQERAHAPVPERKII